MHIFTDGGSRGNPGPAGIGVVIRDGDSVIAEISKCIGNATNNVAEYMAAIYGMQEACIRGAKEVVLSLDSQLVARQLKGEYRVKDRDLRKFFDLALNISRGFDKLEIREIRREDNREADALVNKALDLESLV